MSHSPPPFGRQPSSPHQSSIPDSIPPPPSHPTTPTSKFPKLSKPRRKVQRNITWGGGNAFKNILGGNSNRDMQDSTSLSPDAIPEKRVARTASPRSPGRHHSHSHHPSLDGRQSPPSRLQTAPPTSGRHSPQFEHRKTASSYLASGEPLPVISVAKTLNWLLNIPSNRCCADCRSALVDSSQVHASFRPRTRIPAPQKFSGGDFISRSIANDFSKAHKAFAPPSLNNHNGARYNNNNKQHLTSSSTHSTLKKNTSTGQLNDGSDEKLDARGYVDDHMNYSDSNLLHRDAPADAISGNFSSSDLENHSSIFTLDDREDGPDISPFDDDGPPAGVDSNSEAKYSRNNKNNQQYRNGNGPTMDVRKKSGKRAYPPLHDGSDRSHSSRTTTDNGSVDPDPSLMVSQRIWGHGVFLCAECAKAHVLLGPGVAVVLNVQEMSSWTPEDAIIMKQAGGNTMGWNIYEAFLPESWRRRRPTHASSVEERLTFCRAKYEALAFILPPTGGPKCDIAWRNIVNRHKRARWAQQDPRNPTGDIRNLYALSLTRQSQSSSNLDPNGGLQDVHPGSKFVLPSRLVDFFCVVKSSGFLDPRVLQDRGNVDLSTLPGPEDVALEPRVIDCYPDQDSYQDLDFPEHVATFVLPEGCRPSDRQISPQFFTFVLTSASGHRLYGATLKIYDEAIETAELRDIMEKSGYEGASPTWLAAAGHHKPQSASSSFSVDSSGHSSDYMDIVYLPKCLVVLSHYPFFDLFRNFLLQLYRITLVEAPLPIERFITNFCCEIPLPPQGKVEVKFGFTVKDIWSIQRPPENKLPLANFSFKPLFATMSVGNIMAVVACLLQESRVALCTSHYPLLGPACEALLSFLFPLQWQGMYIPVMPYSMLDILDAPVPFLVGLHARYLEEFKPSFRPHGVVFVDLDKDVVHLGYDDESNTPRTVPALPDKAALKLRSKLEEFGACAYLSHELESETLTRTITSGEEQPMPDYRRESYAATHTFPLPGSTTPFGSVGSASLHGEDRSLQRPKVRRRHVLRTTDKAYQENELLTPITGFLSEQGQLYGRDNPPEPAKSLAGKKTGGFFRRLRSQQSFSQEENSTRGPNLLDLQEPQGFSTEELRNAFLRFFVSLFRSYEQFLNTDNHNQPFQTEEFLADLNLSFSSRQFVEKSIKTQMFQRFLEARQHDPCDPLFLFFDESIVAKQNRSKRLTVRQRDTPFLDDPSGAVKETFTPPPPSNWGLPDDGRTYQYGSFPKLNRELFGKVRKPMEWPVPRVSTFYEMKLPRLTTSQTQVWQHEVLTRTLAPMVATPGSFFWAAKQGVKNLESAIGALSHKSREGRESSGSGTAFLTSQKRGMSPSPFDKFNKSSGRPETTMTKQVSHGSLASAEQLLLNARRIQGILLGIIIKLQALCRMHTVRKRYKRFLKAVRFLQYKWREIPHENKMTEMDHLEQARRSAIKIQRIARSYVNTRHFRRQIAAIALLQRWGRGAIWRRRLRRIERACLTVQMSYRSRRAYFGLCLLRQLLAKAQAHIRGWLARLQIESLKEQRMARYREHIFLLWGRLHTPLSYRTKFWPMISRRCGFLRLRIAESELERMWITLEVDFNAIPLSEVKLAEEDARALQLGKRLGMGDFTYSRYLRVREMTASMLLFPAEERRNPELRLAAERVDAERIQIYERLSVSTPASAAMLITLYGLFKIDKKDKSKKIRLAEVVWCDVATANQSQLLMVEIFPELEESSNIIFNTPSKKALKRFSGINPFPPRLGKASWAHSILSEQISRNVREVAINSLRGVQLPPVLSSKQPLAVERYLERKGIVENATPPRSMTPAARRRAVRRELTDGLLADRSWTGST